MITFGTYWPLLLLLVIPAFWWMQRRTLTDLSPTHLRLSGSVRSAIIVCVAFAVMQPVVHLAGSWLSVIYVLDVSQSASPAAVQAAISWIEQANTAVNPDHARYVAFGSNAAVFDSIEDLKKSTQMDRTGTNLDGAVETALNSFATHYLKRLVLITDGNETSGHITDRVSLLKKNGVRTFTIPLESRMSGDIWVEAVTAPTDVAAEQLFRVEVHVYSQTKTQGEVELKHGERTLGTRKVQLIPGLNSVAFETNIRDQDGPVAIEAEVKTASDPFPGNNTFRTSIVVRGRPKVLYVEGRPESTRYLHSALHREGFSVSTIAPKNLPGSAAQLDAYDAVVLSDVARKDLSAQQMHALATYVRDLGGGFILAGGENNYGEGGYTKTEIEKVLPVSFDTKKERPKSVSIVVVLDKSGSMGGDKIELAKEATKAPLQLLTNEDLFGVVAFDFTSYWAVPFQSAANREQITGLINEIAAAGETNIYPAVEAAYTELERSPSEIKHVILLSDGRSVPSEYEPLLLKMAEAKITVSTIAVGTGADQELLEQIAKSGHGRSYYLEEPSHVPQIFTKETELATGNTLREESFTPVIKKAVEAFKGIDLSAAPQLLGYVATKSKPTSEVLLESSRQEPVLARWQYGLGKTAVFTSDLKDRWASNWLEWKGYPKFWSQLLRETMRKRDDSQFDLNVVRDQDEATITASAVQKDGQFRNKLDSQLRIVAPDQSVEDIPIRQIAPGSYRARVPLKQNGAYLFRALDEKGSRARTLEYSYPAEYHFYPANTELLKDISSKTGGSFQPAAGEIFDTTGEITRVPTPLWPYLAAAALLLYIIDIGLRRTRLFEVDRLLFRGPLT